MADLDALLADLNDRIDDVSNAQVPAATKTRYLNHGIRALWPKLYETNVDTSVVLVDDQYEYAIPAATGDHAMITRVEVETGVGTNRYLDLEGYEILPTLTSKSIRLDFFPSLAGAKLRVFSATRIPELVNGTDVFGGPPGTEEIPVWYALGLVMGRGHEGRVDYTRYSTVAAENGVDINEVMNSVQFCFAQFSVLLSQYEMPLPSRVG